MIKPQKKSQVEIMRSIRGSWGNVNPVTKVVPDKTKYTRKEKHKRKLNRSDYAFFV